MLLHEYMSIFTYWNVMRLGITMKEERNTKRHKQEYEEKGKRHSSIKRRLRRDKEKYKKRIVWDLIDDEDHNY